MQVDYVKVGLLFDPVTEKRRTVYSFIGTLSYSRHKYVEIVYSQDQKSFVESHVRMFKFFGGVPKTIVIDNLKSGVIKPDLYNPQLNRSYSDMAGHYNCFIDTARVATPKDKPKVERDVQTVREEFKVMLALNENLTITEANKKFRSTVQIAKHFNLIGGKLIAGDSTKLRAQNSKKNNFNKKEIKRHLAYIENKLEEYNNQLQEADNEQSNIFIRFSRFLKVNKKQTIRMAYTM
ncbi:integrase core domain protein [bacterium BMS3Abin04]|nr:integrase core domain protein [bacterium BMS3Abin04]